MKLSIAVLLSEILEETGNYEVEVGEEYSGRGMYGKTTAGIVTDATLGGLLVAVLQYFAYNEIEDGSDLEYDISNLYKLSSDSMGLSTIIY